MALVTTLCAELVDGPLDDLELKSVVRAPEGNYAGPAAVAPTIKALVAPAASPAAPVAILLPLDDLFEERIETARQIRRTQVIPTPLNIDRCPFSVSD
jgi:hypothetical protein